MISLKLLLATLSVLSIWSTLPTATRCDTSYYEQYYSARRFLPLKKGSLVQVNLTLSLGDENLLEFEKVALVGDVASLGSWQANKGVILNKTLEHGMWQASLWFNANSSFHYRYFVAAQDKQTGSIQVRRWESAIKSRYLNISTFAVKREDMFGIMTLGASKEIQRGWLNSGHIVQFKLFRHPLKLNDTLTTTEQRLRVKLTPVDPEWRAVIIPSARAYSEYVRMEYENSFLRPQPNHGVLYGEKDIIMFQTSVSDMQNVAYLMEIYVEDIQKDVARVIAYQYIYPHSLSETEGELSVTLISSTWMNTIGVINLKYLIIHPLSSNSLVNFRNSFVQYWRESWSGLEAGHRGLGKSLKELTNAAPPILENSVASMLAASELGADLVEFDVQLTKDLVPIIYHDFSILVCMESKTPTSKDDLTPVFIKDITYEQLKDLTTYQVIGSKIVEYTSHNSLPNETHRIFPSFEDFLIQVNKSLGFDIEIKWPQLLTNGQWESSQTIDKNLYVDRILEVMLKHGCGRLSFFSSFDADICSLIRYKQNMYPVMLLSPREEAVFTDPRTDTIYDALNNAQAFDLAGIIPNVHFIKNNTDFIQAVLKQNKKIFLWGSELKDRETIDWVIAHNPTGVIYDRMDLYLTANKTSVFAKEPDLPEFFNMQCSPVVPGSGENKTITNILSNVNML